MSLGEVASEDAIRRIVVEGRVAFTHTLQTIRGQKGHTIAGVDVLGSGKAIIIVLSDRPIL